MILTKKYTTQAHKVIFITFFSVFLTRESDFPLGECIFLNIKMIIFSKRHQLNAKLATEIGSVNEPVFETYK